MFDRLTDTFNGLVRKLSGNDKLTEKNVADAMADVRAALLDADVHVGAVDEFCKAVLDDALGQKVIQSVEPGQQMVGIVHKRLVELLGGAVAVTPADERTGLPIPMPRPVDPDALITRVSPGPTVILMCGLQGSGKTTTCAKLAAYLRRRGRTVMLAACDLQRPAAVEQLANLTQQVNTDAGGPASVTFYGEPDKVAAYGKAVGVAVDVAKRALAAARSARVDTLIIDTAGRLHVNDELMNEVARVKDATNPHHVFLVVDAMTGQDAVTSARAFNERLAVDGVILSKFDSDTRGGAALSVRHVTGAAIKFVGVGEKIDALEEFHPDRAAGRILGMGDVVSLVEKASQEVSEEEAKTLQERMMRGEMSMDDFLKQLKSLRRMGPLKNLLGLLPGVGSMLKDVNIEDKQLDRVEAIINSMTRHERSRPGEITFSRRRRIARGAGVKEDEVGRLVKQFDMVSKMTREMARMGGAERAKMTSQLRSEDPMAAAQAMRGLGGFGRGTTHTSSIKDRFKKRKR
ncbi:MAG TPA: signal recognition particle receptor subunit alpha [Phycisphaerales bacterium]|nr:signal recognition particle receptor subunit alpha [Phycisphaerales bacterium]